MRGGYPIVPIHIAGTDRVLPKGARRPSRGPIDVTFGSPLWPQEGESSHRLSDRIEDAVATLADERSTDWWTARRRAAAGRTPVLTGPDAGAWRRSWALERGRRAGRAPSWP